MSEAFSKNSGIFTIGPSRYVLSTKGTGGLAKWKIVLADDSCRELLKSSDDIVSDFNIRALPVVGLPVTRTADLHFEQTSHSADSVSFEPDDQALCQTCIPRIKYSFSDLSFGIELQLENVSMFPIYWCPVIRLGLHLPWYENLTLDQYSVHSKSKKKLTLGNDYVVLDSGKCPDRLSLAGLEDGNILAITGLQDPKIVINTKNEEESINVALGGKYQSAHIGLRKTQDANCTELLCMIDLPSGDETDLSRYKCISSKQTGTFAIELSVF